MPLNNVMAYFNPCSTNGASLEDCHTNVFVLTELNGLKWCRWCSSNTTVVFNDVVDDPVLCAYGRCVTQGYLCVWRRSLPVHASSKVDLRLSAEKELWVFWYGDEPDWGPLCISLTKIEEGSWEKGVEYETRTMLFKALHNQIDRVLLNYGYLRIGKWYAQPLDFPSSRAKSTRCRYVIAFRFSFFVHGENNVCVTVAVQRHAPVYRLSQRLLTAGRRRPVILAPWSISAQLAVDALDAWPCEPDAQEQRCLQDWSKFYAFSEAPSQKVDGYDRDAKGSIPRVVEVILNGVKLKYPSRFVVAVDEDADAPDGPAEEDRDGERPTSLSEQHSFYQWMCEKACEGLVCGQKCVLEPSSSNSPLPVEAAEESVGAWRFTDLSQKDCCGCAEKVGVFSTLRRAQHGKMQPKGRTASAKHAGTFHRRRRRTDARLAGVPGAVLAERMDDYGQEGAPSSAAVTAATYMSCATAVTNEDGDWFASKSEPSATLRPGASDAPSPPSLDEDHRANALHARSNGVAVPRIEYTDPPLLVPKYSGLEFAKVNYGLLASRCRLKRQQVQKGEQEEAPQETDAIRRLPLDVVSDDFYRRLSPCHWVSSNQLLVSNDSKRVKLAVHLSETAAAAAADSIRCAEARGADEEPEDVMKDEEVNPVQPLVDGATDKALLNGGEVATTTTSTAYSEQFVAAASGSDTEEDLLHAFLSPPPSHGQEEEGGGGGQKGASSAKGKPKATSAISATSTLGKAPASLDHLGIIYPTPPSQEAVFQLSPEMACHGSVAGSSADCGSIKEEVAPAPRTKGTCLAVKSQQDEVDGLLEDTVTAGVLVTPSFASLNSIAVRRLADRPGRVYRPTKVMVPYHHQQQLLMYPPQAAFSAAPFAPFRPVHHQQADVVTNGACGRSVLSAPASVRSLAEQSPMALLNPPSVSSSSHFARTPRTPINELQSPMSNASSAYARNLSSIEPPVSCGDQPVCCEGHGLTLTLLLSDTVIDLHRDIIFDSCPLCVCNMNIRGLEMGFYVNPVKKNDPGGMASGSHWTSRCTCGFSAVRHRYLSYKSGLFYEDEDDATGSVWERLKTTHLIPMEFSREIVELVRHQSLLPDLTCSLMTFRPSMWSSALYSDDQRQTKKFFENDVEVRDVTDLCKQCLEQACIGSDCGSASGCGPVRPDALIASSGGGKALIHRWGYSSGTEITGSLETMAVLRSLLPLLQESLQKPRGLWQAKHSVEGPLTWRQLHRKCSHRPGSNGREDLSGPEPIPELLIGCDHDWISVSPFSVGLWNRVGLEPFTQPKDVVFIAVVPDSHYVVRKARNFFRELSRTYEAMRLGRHCPITRVLKDGIMRVGKTHAKQLNQKPVDVWFDQFDNSVELHRIIGSKLKLYAQVCRHYLAPHIYSPLWNAFDRSVFSESGKEQQQQPGTVECGPTLSPPVAGGALHSSSAEGAVSESVPADGRLADGSGSSSAAEAPAFPHVVVIYLVNPFTFGPEERFADLNRLVTTGLFRCYLEILQDIPAGLRGSMQLQIIPLQAVLDTSLLDEWELVPSYMEKGRPSLSSTSHLRSLAFSVFSQVRSVGYSCLQPCLPRILTGFGPLSGRAELFRRKQDYPNFRLYSTPAILMPRVERTGTISSGELRDDHGQVLFLTYCLSSKQRWLLSTVTDQMGSMLDSCVINMILSDRKHVVQREVIWTALRRLWDFVVGILATSSRPWRIVIGRFGRLGHEELKAWAHLLSKSQLRSTSRLLREQCSVCQPMPSIFETPAILSACLISTELDANLRLFPDSFVHDDRFGLGAKQCPLSTPEDVTCTHIMVFPTSALIQINQCCIMTGGLSGAEDAEGDFDSLWKDLMTGGDGDGLESGLTDLFGSIGDTTLMNDNAVTFDSTTGHSRGLAISESSDESIQLQPLALGFLISTAPTGPVPDWFWTVRPSAQHVLPVHLRSALHIHTSGVQQSDDQLLSGGTSRSVAGSSHPLDSNLTTDVLRYVLETYNALSWLSLDVKTGDRLSCFPVHVQALSRLYRAVENLL